MPVSVLMPALSPTMTSGTLSRWLVSEGAAISAGDVIAEIETDKATMEVEAVDEGTLGKILVPEHTPDVAVNTMIAVILEDGEQHSALEDFIAQASVDQAALTRAADVSTAAPTKAADSHAPAVTTTTSIPATTTRLFASPLARRIAAQKNIDLTQVTGSGPNGRIVMRDVEQYTPTQTGSAARSNTQTNSVTGTATATDTQQDPAFERVPLSTMRQVIADRLSYAKQNIPHFYLSCDCRIDSLLALRAQMNEGADKADKISLNDMIIKACAAALMRQPQANACFDDKDDKAAIRYFEHSDIAVAVSIPDGLITPLVRRANLLTLGQIAAKTKDLASRARAGKLLPEEYQGGSFTISNLGMYGVDQFQAVINPPHACILAVGRGRKVPVITPHGDVEVATQMNITLSVDHRAVDGAVGAELLSELKLLLENPAKMLL